MIDVHHMHRASTNRRALEGLRRRNGSIRFASVRRTGARFKSDPLEMAVCVRRLYVSERRSACGEILNKLPDGLFDQLPHLARAKEFGYAEHAFRCIRSAGTPYGAKLVHK